CSSPSRVSLIASTSLSWPTSGAEAPSATAWIPTSRSLSDSAEEAVTQASGCRPYRRAYGRPPRSSMRSQSRSKAVRCWTRRGAADRPVRPDARRGAGAQRVDGLLGGHQPQLGGCRARGVAAHQRRTGEEAGGEPRQSDQDGQDQLEVLLGEPADLGHAGEEYGRDGARPGDGPAHVRRGREQPVHHLLGAGGEGRAYRGGDPVLLEVSPPGSLVRRVHGGKSF